MIAENSTPPKPPRHPPIPVTEATAALGNTSDVVVNRFADHPWCAATARLNSATARKLSRATTPNPATGIAQAQIAIAVLRALPRGQPCRIKTPENHPPPTLPTSAIR